MATILTRVFKDEAAARSAANRVLFKGIPKRDVHVIAGHDALALGKRMTHLNVHEGAIDTYAQCVSAGHALLVVRATYKPLNAARIVRAELAKREAMDVGDVVDDFFIPDGPERATSILKDHPRFLTMPLGSYARGLVTEGMGFKTISRKPRRITAGMTGAKVSRIFWPMPLLSKKQRAIKVKRGGGYMSKMFWPMPLVARGRRGRSVIEGGGPVFSKTLDWPTA